MKRSVAKKVVLLIVAVAVVFALLMSFKGCMEESARRNAEAAQYMAAVDAMHVGQPLSPLVRPRLVEETAEFSKWAIFDPHSVTGHYFVTTKRGFIVAIWREQ